MESNFNLSHFNFIKIMAHVHRAIVNEGPEQIVMALYDTGSGADLVGNDGIYSKYFTQFNQKGRYSLSCRVTFLYLAIIL